MKKILTAMSGGVDSAVAAWLLKSRGFGVTGAMMKLFSDSDLREIPENAQSRACCTLSDADDARNVADSMGIPFYVFNFAAEFAEAVTKKFVLAYQQGHTPNPCIDCNRFMQFEKFLQRAVQLECDGIATGHYARISRDGGRFLLKKGLDAAKDQSYVLYAMTQEQLAHTIFPLGELRKDEVRAIAEREGFTNAKKRDSQDICFAPDGDYAGFIENYTGAAAQNGDFVDGDGNVLGKHRGLINYTIGQRKGLGISAPAPLYVLGLDVSGNKVILGRNEDLFSRELTATDFNLIAAEKIEGALRVQAKIRYAHAPQAAVLRQIAEDTFRVEFDEPQRAITAGQAVVCYDGDVVVGGGTIE